MNSAERSAAALIARLFDELADGETRIIAAEDSPPSQRWRYFRHAFNHEYDGMLMSSFDQIGELWPTPHTMGLNYVSLDQYKPGPLSFSGNPVDLLDYYSWGGSTALISDRMYALYSKCDPDGIESVPYAVWLPHRSAKEQFWAIMPARVLDAIDLRYTEFQISRRPIYEGADQFYAYAYFNKGCVFRDEVTDGTPSFVDYTCHQWVWSDALIDTFAQAGMRGFYAAQPCSNRFPPYRIKL